MAEQSEIVLDVKIDTSKVAISLAKATEQVRILKQEQKLLDKALAEGTISEEAYGKAIAESKAELEKASREVKSSTALLQAETLARIDDTSSLDEQRQALNAAQKAYGQLSGAAKEAADAEGGLRDQINALSDRVKEQEAAIGDHRRNVGNYTQSIIDASGQMGTLGGGVSRVTTLMQKAKVVMTAIAAHPIIAVIGALVLVLTKLASMFKNNAAAMEQLSGVFGAFAGIGNAVQVIIDKIAEGLGWIAEKALELADRLGILSDKMKEGMAIAKEDIAIQEEQRKVALQNAESQKRIAELKASAAEKDKYTSKERLAMLQEAADLEENIAKRNCELAKREYELQVQKNAQSASSQEDLKKENDLKIAMLNAETALFNKRKELNGQMAELRKQEQAALQAAVDEQNRIVREAGIQRMEDLRNLAAAEIELQQAKFEELQANAQALLESLNEDEEEEYIPTTDEMVRDMFGLDAEGVEYFHQLLDEGVGYAEAKTQAIANQTQRMTQSFAGSFGQLGNSFNSMASLLGKFSEENKNAAEAQKGFALMGILTAQAQSIAQGALAISEGIASAASVPFPGNIPAILSVVATIGGLIAGVASSIVQAKSIFDQANAQKFATGGIVGGNSYAGDKINARLNSGEMVLNKDSQQRLFDAINGHGDGSIGINYEMMAAAIAAQPAPVVVYKELQEFGEKVSTFDELARL